MIDGHRYRAATEGAAFIDRSARGKVMVRGADRLSYLHAMLTQDVAALQVGRGCYAAYLTAQGRMIADMRVYELGEAALVEVAPGLAVTVVERLDQFVFSEDVQFADETAAWALVRVVGPKAAAAVRAALGTLASGPPDAPDVEALASWEEYRAARVLLGGEPGIMAATREWGLPGLDLFVRAPAATAAGDALAAAGAVPLDDGSAEALRIEAGAPEFLVDMTAETIPLEAGIERRAISFTKGCYPGQEVIIRVLHRGGGRVAKRLVGLVVESDLTPERGAALAGGDKEVGRITSAAWSPVLEKPVALGYVQSDFALPGTALELHTAGGRVPVVTAALPLVRRQ